AADGSVLLQSRAFDSPKDAGRLAAAMVEAEDHSTTVAALVRESADESVSWAIDPIAAALAQLKAEKLAKEGSKRKG
ncbi:MAG: hypothetical protein ABI082_01005, partial [Dokdonella sp.]